MNRLAIALLFATSVLPAGAALGQGRPSFDCGKASNAIERAICTEPALAKADRDLAAAYATLAGKLVGEARDELAKDQVRWISNRNRACTAAVDEVVDCLKRRYASRGETLRAFADGPYPFVSEQALARQGKRGKITWSYDIAYPRFDGTSADFAALNARIAESAKKKAADATPGADADSDHEQQWSAEQSFTVHRPNANTVSLAVTFYSYSGGAHGYGATTCSLVDLRTGRAVGPQGVFAAGDQWLRTMTQIVGADLKKQFVEQPGFDDALEPAKLGKQLVEAHRYCWRTDKLELIFNAYDVGPYSSGSFEVDIPYARLKPLLRADGPMGR
ncbi:hypothetical protein BH11PSE3_BH11PSE3_42970 [soil metagenome]